MKIESFDTELKQLCILVMHLSIFSALVGYIMGGWRAQQGDFDISINDVSKSPLIANDV